MRVPFSPFCHTLSVHSTYKDALGYNPALSAHLPCHISPSDSPISFVIMLYPPPRVPQRRGWAQDRVSAPPPTCCAKAPVAGSARTQVRYLAATRFMVLHQNRHTKARHSEASAALQHSSPDRNSSFSSLLSPTYFSFTIINWGYARWSKSDDMHCYITVLPCIRQITPHHEGSSQPA
jgi:hypothetical protein